ncbi:rod-binding protein [Fluviispira vulneris]|uniref:rod-binding protein n=1 Tax=Fluviispira vulneris TaxID=2763012 RepID=UPI001645ECB8|nr:rod-binding protein [Fluviispira vulneris]
MRIGSQDILQKMKSNSDPSINQPTQTVKDLSKKEQNLRDAENVSKEFETLYIDMMIKSMRQTAKPEDESNAHDIFQGMLDGEYAKIMADAQSFGIRDLILNWMKENDPELNPNIKLPNDKDGIAATKKEFNKASELMNKIKNDSYMSKLAIDQYKMGMGK